MFWTKHEMPLWSTEGVTGASQELPTRDEIDSKYRWHLEDIYASIPEWEADAKEVTELTQKFVAMAGQLGKSAENLLEALQLQDEIGMKLAKLFVFARMRRDEDNANATYQALADKAMNLIVSVESARSFFVPEILEIPEDKLYAFLSENKDLQLYRFMIDEILREKPHILSASEEQLLAAAGDVMDAPSQIYTMFNDADMRFPTIRDENGQEVEITHGRFIQLLESSDRDVRKNAFEAIYQSYGKHRNTLAALTAANVKKDVFYAQARHYPSAREMALDSDNVPTSVYDNLIDAVHDALPALHKYMELRKQALGLDELHLYDLYTPIVPESKVKVTYEEAVSTVEAAVSVLGDEYRQIASDGMRKQGWVDVFETRGKTSGAYSWGTYGTHPYILLNFQGALDDMFTLAHELGHSMHRYYSDKFQPYVYSSYTIFVAEVASTCNEALLLHHLLQTTDDPRKKAYLINHQLESIRGTLYRQTMFAEFEKLTHAHVEAGEALTPDWLCSTYYDLNRQYYGKAAVVDQQIELEWARIPHFYNSFYVYKYATGISAATALSEKILTEGKPAVDRYLSFLQSGGSDQPINLLRKAGVDMESPEPVRAALNLFSRRVDELAGLL